jgi:tRNA A-37 threonylcarbamoyl transferase component Bud32
MDAEHTLELPVILQGRYRLEAVLGSGAMGTVYRGRHVALDIPIAVKVLHPHLMQHVDIVRRTLEEARTSAQLTNENIIRVFDVAQLENGAPFIVMELLNGHTLADHLARHGRLPVSEAVAYVCQVCLGLADAHASGVIHRDLKPENLFRVERGERVAIKILDFGISKAAWTFDARLTVRTNPLGTPAYMSPEQMARPDTVDLRADMWALGVVLYELLTGELPFAGDNYADIALAASTARVRPLRSLAPEIPTALEDVILGCLSRNPADRPGSADELFRLLLPFVENRASGVRFLGTTAARTSLVGIGAGAECMADATSSYPNVSGAIAPVRAPSRFRPVFLSMLVLGMLASGFGYSRMMLERRGESLARSGGEASTSWREAVSRIPPSATPTAEEPKPAVPVAEIAPTEPPIVLRSSTRSNATRKAKRARGTDEPEVILDPPTADESATPEPDSEEIAVPAPPEPAPAPAPEFGGRS